MASEGPDDLTGMDAPTEEDSERDGFLSYSSEWHAMTIGVYRGLTKLRPWADDYAEVSDRYEDVAAEPWYYQGGFIGGTILQVGLMLLMARFGIVVMP